MLRTYYENGVRFVMQADDKGQIHHLTEDGLKHLKTPKDIANAMKEYTDIAKDIRELAEKKILIPVNEKIFSDLK